MNGSRPPGRNFGGTSLVRTPGLFPATVCPRNKTSNWYGPTFLECLASIVLDSGLHSLLLTHQHVVCTAIDILGKRGACARVASYIVVTPHSELTA